MKKIAVLVLVPMVLLLAFSCDLFKPKAEVTIESTSYNALNEEVTVGFTIKNTGTIGIAYWDVWFEVLSLDDGKIKRGYDSGGPLSVGSTASGTAYIDVPNPDMDTVKHYKTILEAD